MLLVTEKDMLRFLALRKRLFEAIAKALELDGHHKSYEGEFEISFPHYFHENGYADWQLEQWGSCIITLNCYVLGTGRHYTWSGKDLNDVLNKCEEEINEWIEEQAQWQIG